VENKPSNKMIKVAVSPPINAAPKIKPRKAAANANKKG
jgi:hypothetical protein